MTRTFITIERTRDYSSIATHTLMMERGRNAITRSRANTRIALARSL